MGAVLFHLIKPKRRKAAVVGAAFFGIALSAYGILIVKYGHWNSTHLSTFFVMLVLGLHCFNTFRGLRRLEIGENEICWGSNYRPFWLSLATPKEVRHLFREWVKSTWSK
jgi:hypothetical protein